MLNKLNVGVLCVCVVGVWGVCVGVWGCGVCVCVGGGGWGWGVCGGVCVCIKGKHDWITAC